MEYKINNNDVKKLISITFCIYNVYMDDKLNDDTRNEYLKLAVEEENKLYNQLEITKENLSSILERYMVFLKVSDYDNETKEMLANRISNHLVFMVYRYPFKSVYNDYNAKLEDINTITIQARKDYAKCLFKIIKNNIETTKSKRKRKKAIKRLNEIRFINKNIEFIDCDNMSIDGRNTCLLFGHSKKLVDSVYKNVCINDIDDCISNCLNFDNQTLEKQNAKIELEFYINCMRANLYLLNKDELSLIIKKFHDRILNNDNFNDVKVNSSISLNMMVDSIKTIAIEKNTAEKSAKKVKNNR